MPTITDGRRQKVVVDLTQVSSPANGPVERIAGRPSGESPPMRLRSEDAAGMAASRRRGAERHIATLRAAKAEPTGGGPGKKPSGGQPGKRSPEARERMRLAQLAAWERRRWQRTVAPPGIEQAYSEPDSPPTPSPAVEAIAPLPCPSCVHAAVCSIRPLLDVVAQVPAPTSPHSAISIEARVIVSCAHFLAGAEA
jgi:hypothetical protein